MRHRRGFAHDPLIKAEQKHCIVHSKFTQNLAVIHRPIFQGHVMTTRCEIVNTYEILEHVMGISGLHPHRLDTVRNMRLKLSQHLNAATFDADCVVVDIGCGSGVGTFELARMLNSNQRVIGLDINQHAIATAQQTYVAQTNLSFYYGDLGSLLVTYPNLKISAAICISVSMFIQDVAGFYQHIYQALTEGGIFIDAPFMFRDTKKSAAERFQQKTYAVCGCNMRMFHASQVKAVLQDAGFSTVNCIEHDFDLMKLPILFGDYPARYLLGNFFRNVMSPPKHFGNISSRYLFRRTLKIFVFFLKHRQKYAAGEFGAVKRHKQAVQQGE